ncbi:MAG TPA: hypothetical protein DCQ98_14240 [Planctomycetaceae bacterium]|nr:hypothetical protein [Planctomycetaceae bacterium]HRF00633.1 alcohol dehydrogenase catalytic domain-containing protein [Pirellulaceae bacterium]
MNRRSTDAVALCARVGSDRGTWEPVDLPDAPGSGEVLCETIELGICGTDRDILASRAPWVAPGTDRLVLGHECRARIVAVGDGVAESLVGTEVVPLVRRSLDPRVERPDLLPPGRYIERGIYRADGFGVRRWLDRPEHLLPIPVGIEAVAVFTEPQSIAEKGIHEAAAIHAGRAPERSYERVPPRVLVTGQGPIAFAAVIAALARGWPTTMVGRDSPDTSRSRLAIDLGADYHDWSRLPLPDGEFDESVEEVGFDLVLEATGSDEAMVRAAGRMRALGVLAWLGCERTPEPRSLPWSALMRDAILRNHLFVGIVNSAQRDFRAAFRNLGWFLEQGIAPERLITHRLSIDRSLSHLHGRTGQAIKSIIEFDR